MSWPRKETESGKAGQNTDEDSEAEQTIRLNPPPTSPTGDVEEMELKKIPVKPPDVGYPEIVGRPRRCCKIEHLRYAVFGLNLILSILGFAIIALAVWVRVDPDFWEYNTSLDTGDFYRACYMFMVAGLIILIFAFFGCCGALNEVQWMLVVYMVISFIFFAIEVAAVILIWHAPFNKSIRQALEKTLREKVNHRDEDDSARFFIDFVQTHVILDKDFNGMFGKYFDENSQQSLSRGRSRRDSKLECCGSTSARDYYASAPASCQDPQTGSLYEQGCATLMLKYLQTKAGIVGGIALPILLFHLLSIIVTFCVLRDIRIDSRYSI